jgi:hypothetical protein
MNHITRMQAEMASKDAEIAALREGYEAMISYMRSSKFHKTPYVNVADVILGLRQSASNAYDAANAAYLNEVGPQVEPSKDGWRCPVCHASLDNRVWNDTEAKAAERMRLHWIENHKAGAQ